MSYIEVAIAEIESNLGQRSPAPQEKPSPSPSPRLAYSRQYYQRTKETRKTDYNLLARRGYYRKRIALNDNPTKHELYTRKLEEIQAEIDKRRADRKSMKLAPDTKTD